MTSQNRLTQFSHSLLIAAGLSLLLAIAFALYASAEKRVDRANQLRQRSYLLADELRESSNDLTRMVRTYVATGDPALKQHHQDILDIRDGKQPRPEKYWRPYWDLMLAGASSPRPDSTQAIPLLELMRQAGFTEAEFRKLGESKANSDALTAREFAAMELAEAKGPQAEANQLRALKMLFDDTYLQHKVAVMKPIDDVLVSVDERTIAAVQSAETHATVLRVAFVAVGLALMFMLWHSYTALRDTLGGSLDEVQSQIVKIGGGDFSSAIKPKQGQENSVLGWLLVTQARLRDSEKHFRATFEQVAVGIAHLALDSHWLRVNEKVCTILGYSREELLRLTFEDITHPDDLQTDSGQLQRLLAGEIETYSIEKRYIRKGGDIVWINLTMSLVRLPSGEPDYFIAIIEDIAARKQAEAALQKANDELESRVAERTAELGAANEALRVENIERQMVIATLKETADALLVAKQEAERADLAKSEFLSRMSHELRTPLNSILGFGQLLEMDELSPRSLDSLEHIMRAGQHLLGLINEVLDIAGIESGRQALSIEPVHVGLLLGDALDLVRPLASKYDVELGVPDCEHYVRADQQRLKQIFLNLLSNAVKYNRPGGRVSLSCDILQDKLQIGVSDTGYGLSPEDIQKVYMPFERLGAINQGIEGTGLGLPVTKRLVEAMEGEIGIESVVGQGTTFWIKLPLSQSPEVKALGVDSVTPPELEFGRQGAGRTLLYIEDNLANLKLIERLFMEQSEITLLSAMQGRLGLDLAQEHRPDLILLDLHLPDINGDEVLRRLRADPRTQGIPVIMLSADATPGQIERLLSPPEGHQGARAYLTKPLNVRQFQAVLRETLADVA